MQDTLIAKPEPGEYGDYYATYLRLVPSGDIRDILRRQQQRMRRFLHEVPEDRAGHRYAPGKWSIREVVGHLADSERVFAYRALRIARGDATPLPGFEQNDYVPAGHFDDRGLDSLAHELHTVREATLSLFDGLPHDAWARAGTASGYPCTVRALAYIIAGHELHHLQILQERYLAD